MCGRYVTTRSAAELAATFAADRIVASDTLPADYNVAPTKRVPVILTRRDEGTENLERQVRNLRWGLVPSWSKTPGTARPLINARAETVADKPAFRRAVKTRRCLVPADGYYEWGTDNQGRKQPYFVHTTDPISMAGLYELWRDPTREAGDPAQWLWTCTILTTAAAEPLAWLHHRMPLILPPTQHANWLDPARTDPGPPHTLAADSTALRAYPVTTEVNAARNNGPHLLKPASAFD